MADPGCGRAGPGNTVDTAGITDTGGSTAAEVQAGIFALRAKAAEKLCDSLLAGSLEQCDVNEVERQLGR